MLSFKRKCELPNLNKSAAYCRLNNLKSEAKTGKYLEIKEEIGLIQLDFPYCGYRNIFKQFKKQGQTINKKKIQKIMRKYGLKSRIKRLFKR